MSTQITTSGGKSFIIPATLPKSPVTGRSGAKIILDRYGPDTALFGGETFSYFFSRDVRRGIDNSKFNVGYVSLQRLEGAPLNVAQKPKGFQYPQSGAAGKATERVARALKHGRSVFFYGPAGTGKSSLLRAIAHDMNIEFSLYPMREDSDPSVYLGHMAVVIDEDTGNNKTTFVEGKLLRDIQGRVGRDGIRRPVLIVIDDIDRAPPEHNEIFRHLLDGSKEIFIPEMGRSIPVFPGTIFCATANSRGRGDYGLYSSVQTIDDSLLDRFERFIEAHFLDTDEEYAILAAKYPRLSKDFSENLRDIVDVASTIRTMISQREIFINFSHRVLESWCEAFLEITEERSLLSPREALREAAQDWLERFDEDSRAALLERVLNIYI